MVPLGGSGGMLPQKNLGLLRLILMQSERTGSAWWYTLHGF